MTDLLHILSLVVWVHYTCHVHSSCTVFDPDYCPTTSHGNDVKFTRDLQQLAFGCPGEMKTLRCCATGFISPIIWEQFHTESGQWKLWNVYANSKQRCSHNQSFVIKSYNDERDSGRYRCTVVGHKKNITNEVNVTTANCFEWKSPPYVLKPTKSLYKREPGNNVTLECRGFYGITKECREHGADSVECRRSFTRRGQGFRMDWLRVNGSGVIPVRAWSQMYFNQTRLYEDELKYEREEPGHITKIIRIENINEEENVYGKYRCQLSTRYNGNSERNVTLERGCEDCHEPIVKEIHAEFYKTLGWQFTMAVAGGLLLISILLTSIYFYFKYEIKVYIRDLLKKKPKHDLPYDVFLLYNDDNDTDRQYVQDILYPYLTEKCHYKVHRAEMDFPIPSVRAECYVEAVDKSRSVLAVISPDMIRHEWCEFAFHYTITIAKREMVYLTFRQLAPEAWNEEQKALKAAYRLGKKVKWPKNKTTGSLRRFNAKLRYYLPQPPSKVTNSGSKSTTYFPSSDFHV